MERDCLLLPAVWPVNSLPGFAARLDVCPLVRMLIATPMGAPVDAQAKMDAETRAK